MKITTKITMDVSGLERLSRDIQQRVEDVLDVAARNVEAGWKDRITRVNAVDTGAYRSSVHVVRDHEPLERTVSDAVEYGVYVEFGTVRMAARPCAGPAMEAERPLVAAAVKEAVKP